MVLTENLSSLVVGTDVVGMRVGFRISNQYQEDNQVWNSSTYIDSIVRLYRNLSLWSSFQAHFQQCCAKNCALGLQVERKDLSRIVGMEEGRCNLDVNLSQCQFDTCHYGLLTDAPRARLDAVRTTFTDVARPVLVAR